MTTRHPVSPARVLPNVEDWPLYDAQASRLIEQAALASCAPQALMAQAGLAVAKLALAVAPATRRVRVAAGPGNNGGDGLVAARLLHQLGWQVKVHLSGTEGRTLPADAAWALQQAQAAGVPIDSSLATGPDEAGLVIDALLGLGNRRALDGDIALAVRHINAGQAQVLAVDLPTGLCGDTGQRLGSDVIHATHTLSLLTLKPGLFTGQGRDHAGQVWWAGLGQPSCPHPISARLQGAGLLHGLLPMRGHAQHKGSFGDVLVIGGAAGMGGAASLAATAALAAGAGRVYLARLDSEPHPEPQNPALMVRSLSQALNPSMLANATVVCGCGGGAAVAGCLPMVLTHAARLVLDADALNAVAADATLLQRLRRRRDLGLPTVLTPHPLEAARLLGQPAAVVQADRLAAAQALALQCGGVVVLKGSGTVIAAQDAVPVINPTGNGRLGTAGSGDVLAGWLGGLWSQTFARTDQSTRTEFGPTPAGCASGHGAACAAVWSHGHAAETGDLRLPLCASALINQLVAALPPATAPSDHLID